MTIVVDASVAVRWLFRIEPTSAADELFRPGEIFIAPDLIFSEIANAAWKMVTFANFSAESVAAVLRESSKTFDEVVPSTQLVDHAFSIGVELRHPAYDCFYLALAQQRDCQMVTADDKLVARCGNTRFAKRVRPLITARSGRRR